MNDDDDNFFKALESKESDANSMEIEDDEILHYMKLRAIDITDDPLKWWDVKIIFIVLSQLA